MLRTKGALWLFLLFFAATKHAFESRREPICSRRKNSVAPPLFLAERALCSVTKVKAQTMRIALNGRRERRISLSSCRIIYLLVRNWKGLISFCRHGAKVLMALTLSGLHSNTFLQWKWIIIDILNVKINFWILLSINTYAKIQIRVRGRSIWFSHFYRL